MTIRLDLEPAGESEPVQRAAQDATKSNYCDRFLQEEIKPEVKDGTAQGSAYDLFAGRIGLFRSGRNRNWSQDTGRKFAKGMAEKRRQAYL